MFGVVTCFIGFDLSFCYASKHFDLPTVEFDVVSHEKSQEGKLNIIVFPCKTIHSVVYEGHNAQRRAREKLVRRVSVINFILRT